MGHGLGPATDDYRTVRQGADCPKCNKPGVKCERVFGSWRQVVMVHAFGGRSIAGCILEEGSLPQPEKPRVTRL